MPKSDRHTEQANELREHISTWLTENASDIPLEIQSLIVMEAATLKLHELTRHLVEDNDEETA